MIGQDPEVSKYAAEYMRWNLPGCLLAGQNHLMITWLLCMRYPTASMIIGVSTSILYVPIILFFVYYLDYGVSSFGIAFSFGFQLKQLKKTPAMRSSLAILLFIASGKLHEIVTSI